MVVSSNDTHPNRELVVYVLHVLGGDTQRVHTEDIALKCFELFPESFSWVKYPKYPDKDVVRVALTDARKERYGALVQGRAGEKRGLSAKTGRVPVQDGWILTESGVTWIRANAEKVERIVGSGDVKEHRQKVLRQLKRMREHYLFARYSDSPAQFYPMIGEIADLLRCRVDAEAEVWQTRFDKMRRQASSVGCEDVLDFIAKCEKACREQL